MALLSGAFALGCDGRAREIRARLPDEELLLFDRGSKLSAPCWACHDFYGTQNKIGPYLSSVYGKEAGTANFPGYSQAMRQSRLVFDEAGLDRFLANPQRAVPGTTMVSGGLASPADRSALIFYIQQVTAAP